MNHVTPYTPYEDLPQAMSVAEFRSWARLAHKTAYDLIKNGQLDYIRIGRSIRIPKDQLTKFCNVDKDTPEQADFS